MRRGWWTWMGVVGLVALGLSGPLARSTRGEEPLSLVDWLKERNEDASFASRRRLFEARVGGERYQGTLEQNLRLLRALRGESAGPAPSGPPEVTKAGTPPGRVLRTVVSSGIEVRIDADPLVYHLEIPPDVVHVELSPGERGARPAITPPGEDPNPAPFAPPEPELLPTLPADGPAFLCAAVLAQKAKQFDDGLYAAVELAIQGGPGGKTAFLADLVEALRAADARDGGAEVVEAAARLGGITKGTPGPLARAVTGRLAAFEAEPVRSKPIGFYTWSEDLRRVFRQDRMLQSEMRRADATTVLEALRSDPVLGASYERILDLYAGLTNPYALPDLRHLARLAADAQPPRTVSILPPSRSHESDLARERWGLTGLPRGPVVMKALMEEVLSGQRSLEPRPESGWYDRQTWALEPFLRPERTPEARHLALGERYRRYLAELFQGLLALTRETHVKQLDFPNCEACMRATHPLGVDLSLSVEPVPTHYERRADAYAFVGGVLRKSFGSDGLAGMHRLTADGPVDLDLGTELARMEAIFRGAAEVSRREIGFAPREDDATRAAVETWTAWASSLRSDPDLATDARMMVPVAHDVPTQTTKVWAFLGWTRQRLEIELRRPPTVVEAVAQQPAPWWNGHVHFTARGGTILSPVVVEVDVSRVLDRDEFRRHCDRHRTRNAIVANLR